jgi:hypothetical protein
MWLLYLHSKKSVEVCSAKKVEKCAFDAIGEIVSENELVYVVFFCVGFEFSVSPIPQFRFGYFFLACSFDYDKLCSFEKFLDELFVFDIPRPGLMITMYKKQVL